MIGNAEYAIDVVGTSQSLWTYTVKVTGRTYELAPPIFEVDGVEVPARLADVRRVGEARRLANGVTETVYTGAFAAVSTLALDMVFRIPERGPVVRFHYRLRSETPRALTKTTGGDRLRYLGLSLGASEPGSLQACTEVRLSEFDDAIHSFRLTEHAVPERAFEHGLALMGPILVAEHAGHTTLVAYEHGSQVPDAFVNFILQPTHAVTLEQVKGGYFAGQVVGSDQPYESLWLQFAVVSGNTDAMASAYRAFVLHAMSVNLESRKPYIFYNTWNYQERHKWWNDATFLDAMHQERMLAEIEVAHRMGIEVFVIDTGWYEKTGDWRVSRARFPDGLKTIKAKLDSYGMQMGLWFSPREAAVSSQILQEHRDCLMAWDGHVRDPHPVWETEASQDLCLVSRYWEAFAEELIRLNREVGVTYFKWDAVHQYGCNAAGHSHGGENTTPQERADCYAFELPRYMARVVDRVCAACPDAIVDFDITEGQRAVGLGFLAAGKFFLINNGPYYRSLDDPHYAPGGGMGSNVFVFPGPARARLCRKALGYDRWIPSVLFLTHYLPDDPAESQMVNLASLVLGQNGIWGDLPAVSDEGVALIAEVLAHYKQVRDDVTAAAPVTAGVVGGSPEIHEKINPETGRGLVAIFAEAPGVYSYVTSVPVASTYWAATGIAVNLDGAGRARLDIAFAERGGKLVIFGVA
jgi:alpha-galactosidase